MTKADNDNGLGGKLPSICLYLPNPPTLWAECEPTAPDLTRLIDINGNHWRKILTIFAKICAPDDQWRTYREHDLLQQYERIEFNADTLVSGCRWHLVAGKVSWQQLGFDEGQFRRVDDQWDVLHRDNILLLPYFDYRQLPNAALAKVRALMRADD